MLTSKQYVTHKGSVCPNCGETHVDAADNVYNASLTEATQDVRCPSCNATWTDVFTLTHYRDLNTDDCSPVTAIKHNNELLICEHQEDHDRLLEALRNGDSDLDMDCMPPCDYSVSIGDEQPSDDNTYLIAGTTYKAVIL